MSSRPDLLTVSEVTGALKKTLEAAYGRVRVRGEITGFRRPSSGHLYFALKDDRAQLRAVMFRGDAVGLRFLPADGLEVEAEGEITIYEPRGDLQLLVRRMVPSGIGALMQAFEALKRRLAAEGLFDEDRKRPIPSFPRTVGLVTSATGAAVRDLLRVLAERWPVARVVLVPVPVQGEGAAVQIAAGIEKMGRWGGADVVIVGRGGGSLEDLWAFNEEPVVRAIVASPIPVISAVGHEIDVTLADLAADLRAPTPTAAAALAVPDRREIAAALSGMADSLRRRMLEGVARRRERLVRLASAYGFRKPERFLEREEQRLDDLARGLLRGMEGRLAASGRELDDRLYRLALRHPRGALESARERLRGAAGRLPPAVTGGVRERRGRVDATARALRVLDPTGVLGRGYCLARDPGSRRILRSAREVAPGAPVVVQFSEDRLAGRVERVEGGGPWELDAGGEERRER